MFCTGLIIIGKSETLKPSLMKERRNAVKSLTELYRIGSGPSSSHTMGPEKAARIFIAENPGADKFKVILYGSLAKTGKGYLQQLSGDLRGRFGEAV